MLVKHVAIFSILLILGILTSSISWSDTQNFQHTGLECEKDHCISTRCPPDMVEILGDYCSNLEEECLEWIDSMRCKRFKSPTVCHGKTKQMSFCIDKYEYPNHLGEKPALQITWYQAKDNCAAEGKRLCLDTEWTQACRGRDNLPYPYGYTRDDMACRIDLPWQDPTTHTFEQLDKTVTSGSMSRCVSEYGVYDMTGNADEWAISTGGTPYPSVLKGGHAYGVRNRCTPETTAHGPNFSYYVTGSRCCRDIS